METNISGSTKRKKVMIKKCHVCGHVMENGQEIKKCEKCNKSFLPNHYFFQIKPLSSKEFSDSFCSVDELHEEDLIKGIHVLW